MSGSRLRLKYLLGDDGSQLFVGMYDSQLATDCAYGTASDGVTRCLPTAHGTVGFLASGCSSTSGPQVMVTPSCFAPKYGVLASNGHITTDFGASISCAAAVTNTVYSAGAVISDTFDADLGAAENYVIVNGACQGVSTVQQNATLTRVRSEMPASPWVAANIMTE